MSLETMTKLTTQTVGVGGTAAISFSNIPQEYTDLKILVSARNTTNTLDCTITFNSSTTGYARRDLYGNGSSATTTSASDQYVIWLSQNSDTASTFGNAEIYIPNYSGFNYKSFYSDSVTENNATQAYQFLHAALWQNSSPITSITLTSGSSFAQHSTFTLYGIKNAQKTAGNSIKATGGAISFDGTYVTHTFTSSGTFTPNQSIWADYIVVAGGGGGGSVSAGSAGAGGGGAGGFRYVAPQGLNAIPYSVIVGAGGSATTNGSNSQFLSTSATGGGAGGSNSNGSSGGSGGGGGRLSTQTSGGTGNAGGYSPVEGYAGGTAYANSLGAGGGGSGGEGIHGYFAGFGGAGGLGSLSVVDGKTYAGGGAGGSYIGNTTAAGEAGGGAGGSNSNGSNAIPGTGSGGGGAGASNNAVSYSGGSGGSGTVVIRYKG